MPERDKHVKQIVKSNSGFKAPSKQESFKEDAKQIGADLMTGIFIPAAKDLLYDLIVGGASMSIYHDNRGSKRSSRSRYSSGQSRATYTSYNSISEGRGSEDRFERTSRSSGIVRPKGLSRADCIEIISELERLIEEYGYASIQDYNQTIGYTSNNPKQDNRWGWESLDGYYIEHDVDGFYIVFPRVEAL